MDIEKLADLIERKIWEILLEEVGDERRILVYEPVISLEEKDGALKVDISMDLELSPFVKKSKEEILEKIRREVDRLIQEYTGKSPERSHKYGTSIIYVRVLFISPLLAY